MQRPERAPGGLANRRSTAARRAFLAPRRAAFPTTTTNPAAAPAAPLVSAADPTSPPKPAPEVTGPLPLLGPLDRVSLKALFYGVDDIHKDLKSDVFRMSLLGARAFQIRSPQLMAAVQRAPPSLVAKTTQGFRRVESWLGNTLFNEDDLDRHAEMREALSPAFSPAGVRALVPLFEEVGDELAGAMAALAAGGGGDGGGGNQQLQQVDAEQLCRRATMDAIGRAAFGGFDFGAVAAALPPPQQQQEGDDGAASSGGGGVSFAPPSSPIPSPAASPSPPPSASAAAAPKAQQEDMRDILDVWDRLLRTAMLLSFNFPLPDALVPGWREYGASLARLNAILDSILAAKEAREAAEAAGEGGEEGESGGSDWKSSSSSSSTPDLLSALLKGRRERPDLFTDASVRSTLHLFLFAGSDTTASLLSFLFYELSRRPEAQRRCVAEARAAVRAAALDDEGRQQQPQQSQQPSSQQPPSQPQQQQHPYSPARLPYLHACINETLRLYPPGTDTARFSAADLDLGGLFVPKGSLLLLNNYSLHRHERLWPRPNEWLPERWIPGEAEAAGLLMLPQSSASASASSVSGRSLSSAPGGSSGAAAAGAGDSFQPFGVGARACIGRLFAMLEAAVLASRVLATLELSPGDEECALLQKFTLSSEKGVFLRAARREAQEEGEEGEGRAAR